MAKCPMTYLFWLSSYQVQNVEKCDKYIVNSSFYVVERVCHCQFEQCRHLVASSLCDTPSLPPALLHADSLMTTKTRLASVMT